MNPNKLITKIQSSIYAQSIRHGLITAIPFLILGSFSLLFKNFPSDPYQSFLNSCLQGAIPELLTTVYGTTLGSLALILIVTISLSFGQLADADGFWLYPMVCVCSYLAFCGGIQSHSDYIFNTEWVFTAMCITLLSCALFRGAMRLGSRMEKLHTTGAEYLFNRAMQSLFPTVVVILFFALAGFLLRTIWGANNITNFGSYFFLQLFDGLSGNLFGILLYVILTHVLWFVGIHGTNTLDAVANRLFEHNIEINQFLVLSGQPATEIFSKTFLDTFVFLGGCGCALSFVLALCLASRKSHNRKLSFVALPSALFGISEIAVFGFPIIFNFTMLIPFILTPVVMTLVSTLAVAIGLVPIVTESVEWTVPVLMSGYKATGSVAGSLLQIFNVALGILIYLPFIRLSERQETERFKQAVRQMEQDMAEGERTGNLPRFLYHSYPYRHYAKTLSMDLQNATSRGQVQLFYQPQMSSQGVLHGLEALLRWKHPVVGYIAPPVLINLAYENGFLDGLSYYLMKRACSDAQAMEKAIHHDLFLSVNISPKQVQGNEFLENIRVLIEGYQLTNIHPVLEITERAAMEISGYLKETMEHLKSCGIGFSLDDFGMGHNSLLQLQEGTFDEVKLDGQLVAQLLTNPRSEDIISGIIQMARKLGCRVVAEFVETEEQRNKLEELGCLVYQGYYYSRPLELAELLGGFWPQVCGEGERAGS